MVSHVNVNGETVSFREGKVGGELCDRGVEQSNLEFQKHKNISERNCFKMKDFSSAKNCRTRLVFCT